MRPLPRLEAEPKSGAISGRLFLAEAHMPMLIGMGLMVYPYFVEQTWLLYTIGCGLCAGLFFFRE